MQSEFDKLISKYQIEYIQASAQAAKYLNDNKFDKAISKTIEAKIAFEKYNHCYLLKGYGFINYET